MCGRLFQTLPLSRLLRIARASRSSNQEFHTSSFNVCPTTYIPAIKNSKIYGEGEDKNEDKDQKSIQDKIEEAVRQDGSQEKPQNEDNKQRQLTFLKWGQKTNYNMIINGRIQELTNKKTFTKIIQNRCVVIMEGYYQWKSKEEPFCCRPKNSDHFLVAALYTDENQVIILTKDAIGELAKVHQRMPVILSHSEVELWLDPKNTKDINVLIHKCLTNKQKVIWKNIGLAKLAPYVNKKEQKSSKCLMSLQDYKKQLDNKGLMRFWKKKQPAQIVTKQGEALQIRSQLTDIKVDLKQQRKDFEKKPQQQKNQKQLQKDGQISK